MYYASFNSLFARYSTSYRFPVFEHEFLRCFAGLPDDGDEKSDGGSSSNAAKKPRVDFTPARSLAARPFAVPALDSEEDEKKEDKEREAEAVAEPAGALRPLQQATNGTHEVDNSAFVFVKKKGVKASDVKRFWRGVKVVKDTLKHKGTT